MTGQQLEITELAWALGSCCALAGKPFDADLIVRQFPPPCTLASLVTAARELGFSATASTTEAQNLSAGAGQLLLLVRDGDKVRLGLLVRVGPEGITWIPAGSSEPLRDPVQAFSARFTGHFIRIKPLVEAPHDPEHAGTAVRFGFRWFVPELLKHRKVWRDVLAASLVLQLLALGLPLFTQAIIDKVVVHRTESTLIALAIGMGLFLAGTAILSWVRQYLVLHTGNRVDAVLGATVVDHLFKLPVRYFEHRPTGVVAARLHGVETIREFVSSAAVTLILDIPFLLIAVAVMFWYSVPLTLVALGMLAVIAAISAFMAPVFQARLNEQFLLAARNQAFLTEYIAGLETVKSLQFEPQIRTRYGGYLASYLQSGFRTRQIGNTYFVDDAGDLVIEYAHGGRDTVYSSISYVLPAHVEALVLTGGALNGAGNALDNHLTGNALANWLDGGAGADLMAGGRGNDTYVVGHADDRVLERVGEGRDTVRASISYALSDHVEDLFLTGEASISGFGNALDNHIYGNRGNNLLAGGAGDDTYHYEVGGGLDTIADESGVDTLRFGAGLTLDKVALRIVVQGGRTMAQIRVLDGAGKPRSDQGIDYEMMSDAQMRLRSPIERFVFADGSSHGWDALQVQSTPLVGTSRPDLLVAGRADDRMQGGAGDDALYGGSGHDTLYGEAGNDVLYGGNGNDRLYGGNDADELHGEAGDDMLYGENGDDYLLDLLGNNLLVGGNHRDVAQAGAGADRLDLGNHEDLADAGAGDDFISVGNGDDWVAAGRGNDVIDLGNGRNLLAFNRGDGADLVTGGSKDVLSVGGGIRYRDIALARSGADLVVRLGGGDSVTLQDWYGKGSNRSFDRLQVVTVGADHDPASRDPLRNDRVEVFDFARLVQSFDRARAAHASYANGWSVMNSLLDAHLAGSDRAAIGGDLSFQYHATGSLAGMSLDAALRGLSQGSADWQELRPRSELERGSAVLLA